MALDVDSNQPLSADFKRDPATPRSTEPPSGCVMTFVLQPWQLLLSILAGWINDEQQKRIEYLRTENQVLREKVGKKRILLDDDQRRRLAVKGKVLGRKALEEIGPLFTPDTILRWHRQLVAQKWDHSDKRRTMGRPAMPQEIVDLILQFAQENPTWGYDQIADRLDLGVGSAQPLPECGQRVGSFAIADVDHGPGTEIQDHREIGVTFADRNFVDGDFLEVLELRSAKATMQIPLLNVLDDVPTDPQVEGGILDGGNLRQLPGVAFEGMRVSSAWVGEGNLHLAGMLALEANHTCHFEENEGPLQANGHRLHEAILVSLGMNQI